VLQHNLGLILIQQGRFQEALGPLARATRLDKGKAVAAFHNNLGIALERTGHYTAAADAYRAALGVDETYGKASVNLARVVERTDDPAAGVIDLSAIADSFVSEVERWR
jgi:Flp pilus assembly protein TadD